MDDELNKPLGLKPALPTSQSTSERNWLGIIALGFALVAILIAGWQFLASKPAPVIVAGGQTPAAEREENTTQLAPTDSDASGETESNLDGEEKIAEDGSLTPIEPDGSLVVPEPNPKRAEPQEAGLAHLPDPELLERGASGVIPKRSKDGRRPMDVYAREPDTTGNFGVARVVLIVGGIGISQTSSQQAIEKLPPTVNLAFATTGNSLTRWMQAARKKGHELLLQIPMEGFGGGGVGDRTISSQASAEENLVNLHWAMSRITNYVGIINYQGGKILGNTASLKPVFDELADRGLLFVDDGTSGTNQSQAAAAGSLLPYARAHVLLDAQRSRQAIAEKLNLLVKEAKRTGVAIGVSNGFTETIDMLDEFSKQAASLGIEITPVSAIVSDPESER